MVSNQNFYFLFAVGVFLLTLIAIAGYYYLQARRASQVSWEDLLAKLTRIDGNVIAEVALDIVDEDTSPDGRVGGPELEPPGPWEEPSALWNMIGGLKGLEVLEENSKVLIELACYLQRWYAEALPIAEQLRLDSRALQWHVGRLRGAAKTGNLEVSFPFYAQRAVATYYVMTRRLLALYQAVNFSMLPKLERSL